MWYRDDRPAAVDAVLRAGFAVYYRWAGLLNRWLPPVRDDGVHLVVRPGVYRPLYGESRAAELCAPGERVLDLGCGCGIVGLAAARRGARVTLTDVSPVAVDNARLNATRLGLDDVEVRQADMYAGFDGRFDVILAHPPYIRLRVNGPARQWGTSPSFVERLVAGAEAHLAPHGRLGIIYVRSQRHVLDDLAAAHGLQVTATRSLTRAPLGQRLLRPLFLNVLFGVRLFVVERVPAGAAARSPVAGEAVR